MLLESRPDGRQSIDQATRRGVGSPLLTNLFVTWRVGAFPAWPLHSALTVHRSSRRDSPRPRKNVECPGFFSSLEIQRTLPQATQFSQHCWSGRSQDALLALSFESSLVYGMPNHHANASFPGRQFGALWP